MRLSALLEDIDSRAVGIKIINMDDKDVEVTSISLDSRELAGGALFAALPGEIHDGYDYIDEALLGGAVCVLAEREKEDARVPQIIATDARAALASISEIFYGSPASRMRLVGITGTNGKTTTSYIIEAIFKAAGLKCGVIGTVNYRYNDIVLKSAHTTPECIELSGVMADMYAAGVSHVVVEVSSHALNQKRADGCRFSSAVFTNLTHEHLDYHHTMENYFMSKERLFKELMREDGTPVINIDDHWGSALAAELPGAVTFSLKKEAASRVAANSIADNSIADNSIADNSIADNSVAANSVADNSIAANSIADNRIADVYPKEFTADKNGIRATLSTPAGEIKIESSLVGEYNLSNIMAAVGTALTLDIDVNAISTGIKALEKIPGRLELVEGDKDAVSGPRFIVDYAHTADALSRALSALRSITSGRLITVFGCGGDRDSAKRPFMGEVASRLSDIAIITTDNPRGEDPVKIIGDIEAGMKDFRRYAVRRYAAGEEIEGPGYMVIVERREAIRMAVALADVNDTVLVAGKGHEDYQLVGDKSFSFDDREELRLALKERSASSGARH